MLTPPPIHAPLVTADAHLVDPRDWAKWITRLVQTVNDLPLGNLVASTNASRLVGRQSGSAGDFGEISLGTGLSITGSVLSAGAGGFGVPGGADTDIQFNQAGAFGGSADLTWDGTTVAIGNSGVAPGALNGWGTIRTSVSAQQHQTDFTNILNSLFISDLLDPSADTTTIVQTALIDVETTGAHNFGVVDPILAYFDHLGTGSIIEVVGVQTLLGNRAAGSIGSFMGCEGSVANYGAGTVTTQLGLHAFGTLNYGAGHVVLGAGLYVNRGTNASGTVDNNYGIYLEDQTLPVTGVSHAVHYAAPASKDFFINADGTVSAAGGAFIVSTAGNTTATSFVGPLTGNASTASSAAKWTAARTLAGNSVDGSVNVAFANKVILQGTTDAGFSNAQFLGALGTGIVKNTTTTGVLSIAVAGDIPNLAESQITGLVSDLSTLTTAVALRATLASPTLTGVPLAPTAAGGTNTTQIATTAFVTAALVGVGSGTVTSVGLSLPALFTLSGTPVTTAGTLTAVLATQTANFIWAGPTSGAAAAPTFRALVGADVPTLNQNTSGSAATLTTPRAINGTTFDGSAAITVTAAAGTLTGATLAAGVTASSLTSVGTLATLTVTAAIVGSVTGNAATVTTNANLTGVITSVGNATSIASQTGTGTKFVVDTSPTLVTPVLGVSSGTSLALTSFASSTQSIAATSTDGLLLTNTTPAAAGAQQWSPRIHLAGKGWQTNGPASEIVDWILELQTIQGSTHPTGSLIFSSQVNGAGYTARYTQTSSGDATITGQISAGGNVNSNGNVVANQTNGSLQLGGVGTTLITDGDYVLALRNTTHAEKFRIYNTWTTTNTAGEWWKADWQTTANQFRFGAAMGTSTGTARAASWDYGAKEASPTAAITVPITSGAIAFGGSLAFGANLAISNAVPTITSGFGAGATIAGITGGFRVTCGTVPGVGGTIAFNTTFANIPVCFVQDETTGVLGIAAPTTTTVVVSGLTLIAGQTVAVLVFGY